ncbi:MULTISPECIES: hypothetical protein [Aerococcus]|nr:MULTISPECIES: hypothetical protein [Aerococcus]MCY3029065.1 hypothetical protein [Aerococcus loyolae]MDK6231400.1 hypothetical protein [Aerococcus urinae]MDK6627047.1 hypothetical protein [Aerococcus urinae]MDK6907962.1 hypothetical protein [Aerococcus urinae]WJO99341.1 hypothetical protein DBT39_07615 [Aerococcus loyolae]
MKWTSGILLEQIWVRTAKAYDPIFHIACLVMANDQLQSFTPAHSY